jgi:hypothetical protein
VRALLILKDPGQFLPGQLKLHLDRHQLAEGLFVVECFRLKLF